jgi:large subunit ribosomal protein L21
MECKPAERQASHCPEALLYAVVRTGGRQYRVREGRPIIVGRLAGEPGDTVELGDVLIMADGDDITVGAPTIAGARVLGEISEQGRAKKIVVFRYKAKTRSRKKTGHRQHFTKLIVRDILAPGQEPRPKDAPVEAQPEVERPKARRGRKTAAAVSESSVEIAEAPAAVSTADEPAPKTRRRRKAE